MNDWSITMAERLKALREKRGLSHISLSNELQKKYGVEISRDSLMNYEVFDSEHKKAYKNIGMSVKYLWCLADFYGVSADYLLGKTNTQTVDSDIASAVKTTGLTEEAIVMLSKMGEFPMVAANENTKLWSTVISSAAATLMVSALGRYANARIADMICSYYMLKWHEDQPHPTKKEFDALSKSEQDALDEAYNKKRASAWDNANRDILSVIESETLPKAIRSQVRNLFNYGKPSDDPRVNVFSHEFMSTVDVYRYSATMNFEELMEYMATTTINDFLDKFPMYKAGDEDA